MSHHTSDSVAISWMAEPDTAELVTQTCLIHLFRMIYAHQSGCFCHWINGNIFTQLVAVITHSYVHVISFLLPSLFPFFSFNNLLLTHSNNCFLPSLTRYFTSHALYLHYLITFLLSLFHRHHILLRCPLPSILPAHVSSKLPKRSWTDPTSWPPSHRLYRRELVCTLMNGKGSAVKWLASESVWPHGWTHFVRMYRFLIKWSVPQQKSNTTHICPGSPSHPFPSVHLCTSCLCSLTFGSATVLKRELPVAPFPLIPSLFFLSSSPLFFLLLTFMPNLGGDW